MRGSATILSAIALVGLGACSEPEERDVPPDIERMNELALGPPVPIVLQPISFDEAEQADMLGAGCNFMRDKGGEMLLIAQDRYALFKHDGRYVKALSDSGSEELPFGAYAHYDGKENAVRISIDRASEQAEAHEVVYYDGAISIGDERDRTVFTATGVLECGA